VPQPGTRSSAGGDVRECSLSHALPARERSTARTLRLMGRRAVLALLVVCIAYGVGWMSDVVLNDDPCVLTSGREIDRYDLVERWFPVRTDCRVTTPSGETRVEKGSSEVFIAMFALVLVVGLAFLSGIALAARAVAVVAAGAAAFLAIFIL
jgi:hypothetical protein